MMTKIRGHFLCPDPDHPRWTLHEDAVLTLDADGVITNFEDADGADATPITRPGVVWMPGFVDTHIHFPQTRVLGSASGALLPWLEQTVFPEESRFIERAYAESVAEAFLDQMARHGTTCASIFSSSDPGATDVLFEAMARRGVRGDVGLTLMDRGAPEVLLHGPDTAIPACEMLVGRWHGHDRDLLRFRVTPRFAISCTDALLEAAGDLCQRHGLAMQTHISENPDEIAYTAELFPAARDYLGVYEDAGLLQEESIFAHGVWLEDREWDAIRAASAAVSHCPDSNFFLGSGVMPLHKATSRGIRLGLGTDVGAGRSFSLRTCCSRGYDASRLSGSDATAASLLWYATRGGARAMGRASQIGCLAEGFDADLVAIRPPRSIASLDDLCEQLVFLEDHHGVEETLVRGQPIFSA